MNRDSMLEFVHKFYPNWMPLTEQQLRALYFRLLKTGGKKKNKQIEGQMKMEGF